MRRTDTGHHSGPSFITLFLCSMYKIPQTVAPRKLAKRSSRRSIKTERLFWCIYIFTTSQARRARSAGGAGCCACSPARPRSVGWPTHAAPRAAHRLIPDRPIGPRADLQPPRLDARVVDPRLLRRDLGREGGGLLARRIRSSSRRFISACLRSSGVTRVSSTVCRVWFGVCGVHSLHFTTQKS